MSVLEFFFCLFLVDFLAPMLSFYLVFSLYVIYQYVIIYASKKWEISL